MREEKLKPCPFCGGEALMWRWNGGVRIDCGNWTLTTPEHIVGVGAKTAEEAIKLWNKRELEE